LTFSHKTLKKDTTFSENITKQTVGGDLYTVYEIVVLDSGECAENASLDGYK
jgi:hypothetical protein